MLSLAIGAVCVASFSVAFWFQRVTPTGRSPYVAVWKGSVIVGAENTPFSPRLWYFTYFLNPPLPRGSYGFYYLENWTRALVGVPLWPAAVPFAWAAWKHRKRPDPVKGVCRICGYDLRGTPKQCPECGTVAAHDVICAYPSEAPNPPAPTDSPFKASSTVG